MDRLATYIERIDHAASPDAARTLCEQALTLDPNSQDALKRLGDLSLASGDGLTAVDCFQRLIAMRSNSPAAFRDLAAAWSVLGDPREEVDCLRGAVERMPQSAESRFYLGCALQKHNRIEEAVDEFRRAAELQPKSAASHNNLGSALVVLGSFDDAVPCFRRAIELLSGQPGQAHRSEQPAAGKGVSGQDRALADAWSNLGDALMHLNRHPEAEPAFRKALAIDPTWPDYRRHLGIALLAMGRFREGWDHYEGRKEVTLARPCNRPRWDGSALAGKTILVSAEQGMGDTIQFARYLPMLYDTGAARVIFECYEPLMSLFASSDRFGELLPRDPDRMPPLAFDTHIQLMSLPRLLGTDETNFPVSVPYLTVDPQRADAWRKRLPNSSALRVGLAWAGNPDYASDRSRSVDPDLYSALGSMANVEHYSLQVGPRGLGSTPAPSGIAITDLSEFITDYADTAAAMSRLDLIITVDTSVAHLAGALGRPVWTLLPFGADWRWMRGRSDTPWYATMRLFCQTRPGDWAGVIDRVAASLRGESAGREACG